MPVTAEHLARRKLQLDKRAQARTEQGIEGKHSKAYKQHPRQDNVSSHTDTHRYSIVSPRLRDNLQYMPTDALLTLLPVLTLLAHTAENKKLRNSLMALTVLVAGVIACRSGVGDPGLPTQATATSEYQPLPTGTTAFDLATQAPTEYFTPAPTTRPTLAPPTNTPRPEIYTEFAFSSVQFGAPNTEYDVTSEMREIYPNVISASIAISSDGRSGVGPVIFDADGGGPKETEFALLVTNTNGKFSLLTFDFGRCTRSEQDPNVINCDAAISHYVNGAGFKETNTLVKVNLTPQSDGTVLVGFGTATPSPDLSTPTPEPSNNAVRNPNLIDILNRLVSELPLTIEQQAIIKCETENPDMWAPTELPSGGFYMSSITPYYSGKVREITTTLHGEEVKLTTLVTFAINAKGECKELLVPVRLSRNDGQIVEVYYDDDTDGKDEAIPLEEFLKRLKPLERIQVRYYRGVPGFRPGFCGPFTFCGWKYDLYKEQSAELVFPTTENKPFDWDPGFLLPTGTEIIKIQAN